MDNMIKNKIKISDSKQSKSLDMLVTAKHNPDITTRPTILNHSARVADPMISRSDHKESDNIVNDNDDIDSTTQLEASSDSSTDENSDTEASKTKSNHHKNEDLKQDLVNSGQYFLNIEKSKSRHFAWGLVFITVVAVICLSFGMIFLK